MADETEIAWTDSTFNPWWGCSKVSAAFMQCFPSLKGRRNRKRDNDEQRGELWAAALVRPS